MPARISHFSSFFLEKRIKNIKRKTENAKDPRQKERRGGKEREEILIYRSKRSTSNLRDLNN
jgi:hypothetical protein